MTRRPPLVLAAAAVAALALASCGDEDPGDVSDIRPVAAECGDVVYSGSGSASKLIVSDLPLRGDSAERSTQMNAAIVQELARKGWQAGPDIQLAFQACDDSLASTGEWDAERCRSNARAYAANPDVIGVIGTSNSGCTASELPILNRAGIPMVSPGDTFPCLTESGQLCRPEEPGAYYPTGRRSFVRVIPDDSVQAAGLAAFASELGVREPYIVAPLSPAGGRQATLIRGAVLGAGMRIAGEGFWDPKARDYRPEMERARSRGADAILLAGEVGQTGARVIRDKVAVLGPNGGMVKLLAMDGFAEQATIDQTGPASAGMYVSLPGRAPASLAGEGADFVHEIRSQIGHEPIEVFAPYAGEATEVLVNAIRVGEDRAGAIETLFRTRVTDGIIGSFSITPSGDPSPAPITVQRAGEEFELAGTIAPLPALIAAARGR